MATLSELQVALAQLEAARGTGVRRVSYQGKTTEFRDMTELEKAIAAVRSELNALAAAPVSSASLAAFRRQSS